MISMDAGMRVGAVESISHSTKEIKLYGYGIYLGDDVPKVFAKHKMTNPHIKLDSGKEVWGYQCWWSAEAPMKRNLEAFSKIGYKITVVEPPEDKAEEREEEVRN